MDHFAFKLGDKVALTLSGERGVVVGRYEAADHPPQYNVRYVAGDGRQVTCWLWASEIKHDGSVYDDPNFNPERHGHF